MPATLINGRAIADEVLSGLAAQVAALQAPLQLAAVCVGDNDGLKTFVRIKQKAAQSLGIEFSSYYFDATKEEDARQLLEFLAKDDDVQGIFVELPLPSGWDSAALIKTIPATKDVDVLSRASEDAFYGNEEDALLPPAVRALRYVVDAHQIPVTGSRCAVVGAGDLVGKPIAHWLSTQGAQVEVIDIATVNPKEKTRDADIIIAATGVPGLITGEWVKEGATIIDYGYGKKGNVYVGDVDAESVYKKAGLVTPVPGGMGPLVVAAVLENLLVLAVR